MAWLALLDAQANLDGLHPDDTKLGRMVDLILGHQKRSTPLFNEVRIDPDLEIGRRSHHEVATQALEFDSDLGRLDRGDAVPLRHIVDHHGNRSRASIDRGAGSCHHPQTSREHRRCQALPPMKASQAKSRDNPRLTALLRCAVEEFFDQSPQLVWLLHADQPTAAGYGNLATLFRDSDRQRITALRET